MATARPSQARTPPPLVPSSRAVDIDDVGGKRLETESRDKAGELCMVEMRASVFCFFFSFAAAAAAAAALDADRHHRSTSKKNYFNSTAKQQQLPQ